MLYIKNCHSIHRYLLSIALLLVVWGMMYQQHPAIVRQEEDYLPTSAVAAAVAAAAAADAAAAATTTDTRKNTTTNRVTTIVGVAPVNIRVKEHLAYAMKMNTGDSEGTFEVADAIDNSSCPPTSSFRVEQIYQGSLPKTSSWILISLDEHGRAKTAGGDEVFVTYHDASWNGARATHVALVTDRSDGTYSLDFWTTPMIPDMPVLKNHGTLTIKLMHTCHIGAMAPPTKNTWRNGGLLNARFVFENTMIPHFSHHRLLISFGDSLYKQFVKKGERKWHRPGVYWKQNPDLPLNTTTMPRFLELLEEWHGDELRKGGVGLVIGSAAWDVIHNDPNYTNTDPGFVNHLQACREYATAVRDKYPAAVVYWRLPYALQPHVVDVPECLKKPQCIDATRYMSVGRMEYLYDKQKMIMQELQGINAIDFYKASYLSGEWSPHGDGRHYLVGFNRMVLNWLYNDSFTNAK